MYLHKCIGISLLSILVPLYFAWGAENALPPATEVSAPSWKIGDEVPVSDLPPYTDLENPVLSEVGVDSITVSHGHGTMKIPYSMLPPAARQKYGMERTSPPAAPAAETALPAEVPQEASRPLEQPSAEERARRNKEAQEERKRQFEDEIRKADKEAKLLNGKRLNGPNGLHLMGTTGFRVYQDDLVARSGNLVAWSSDPDGKKKYNAGPLRGKTEAEGRGYAKETWLAMTDRERASWEDKAASLDRKVENDRAREERKRQQEEYRRSKSMLLGQ